MPETNKNQRELSMSRILLLALTIVFFVQFILSLISTDVTLINVIVLSVIGFSGAIIYLGSYRSTLIHNILVSKQFILYLYFFGLNWLVLVSFGNSAVNDSFAIGIILMGLTITKTFKELIVTLIVGVILYLLSSNIIYTKELSTFSIVFITLFFGLLVLQIVKLYNYRRYLGSEQSIGGIFNNLSEPVIMANKRTLTIDYCNAFAAEILKSKENILNLKLKFSSLVTAESQKGFFEIIKQIYTGKLVSWKGELELLALNGQKIWVLCNINLVRFPDNEKFVIKINDISKIKFFEDELKKSLKDSETQTTQLTFTKRAMVNVMEDLQLERDKAFSLADDLEKFKLAVENASDHIVITDPDGITLFANAAVAKITGYSKEEVIGTKAGKLWSLPMGKEFYTKFWDVIKNQKTTFEGEIQNKRKNGEKYYAQVTISPILNDKGEVEFFVGIEKDITKSKEIDKVRSEFVSVASHQLRTPLTSIKWYIELLREDDKNLTDAQKNIFKEIEDSNSRMISLVNDLLNVSRIETGEKYKMEKKWENIITLLRTVVDEQQIIAGSKNITINLDNGGFNEFMMSFDRSKLYQAIANLINNAIKYSKNDSTIELKFTQNGDNAVSISVIDHGIGIPESEKYRVFEKFFRAENALKVQTDGTGLGLYFAKSVVTSHGGEIVFDSVEGQGTTFTIKLPIN